MNILKSILYYLEERIIIIPVNYRNYYADVNGVNIAIVTPAHINDINAITTIANYCPYCTTDTLI